VRENRSLTQLLLRRASDQPGRDVYHFRNESGPADRLSYVEVLGLATGVGAALVEVSAPGDRVLVLCPSGRDFVAAFLGCLYTGRTAVPAYIPVLRRADGLANIVADSGARVVVGTSDLAGSLRATFAEHPALAGLVWVYADQVREPAFDLPETSDEDGVAFLQYTSGSTGSPRGVRVSNRNLTHNLDEIRRAFRHGPESRGVTWLPPFHDMGLVGGLLQPLYADFPVTVMSPMAFLRAPGDWLRAIAETGATSSGAPNFAFELCVRRVSEKDAAGLDLSAWQLAFVGAEPINPTVLTRFAEHFAVSGFRRESFFPCYGLAESTLYVTGGPRGAGARTRTLSVTGLEAGFVREGIGGDSREVVSCGRWQDARIEIVDPDSGRPCAPGRVGEVWVSWPSVTDGYWNREAENAEHFRARLAGDDDAEFLRTGDLGFVLDGELYITGRRKELMVIHGRNIFPQDIERTVEAGVSEARPNSCLAFSVDVEQEERLVVMVEIDRHAGDVDRNRLAALVRDLVSREHRLSVFHVSFVRPGQTPRTTSGKPQRWKARSAFLTELRAGA
jgi:acyl-CoA synthetase (AMP-forming)/AMP-acid ligase II